jgi:beta-lactamase regulating signal transducer with metallopeptidase domain
MIAAWMLYCALWTLWLSAVAWTTERWLLNSRGAVRMVWLSAMVLAVVGPIIGYSVSSRAPAPIIPAVVALPAGTLQGAITVKRSAPEVRLSIVESMRTTVARIDRPLAIVWLASTLGLLLYIGGGVARLRIVRRRWQPAVVAGHAVMISDDTGPALVGVFDATIVIPTWALELERDALSLMLRHELEHRAAGDTRTLAVAQALVVLMPWNPLMWWQLRRLRLAIELDCDARVLRHSNDVAAYGKLLLEFSRQPRGLGVVGAALADHRASHLEARIRRMTRHVPARPGRVVVASIAATAIAIAIGCQLPTPPAPAPTEAVRTTRPARADSVTIAKDTALTSRVAHGRSLDTMSAHDRELLASINRELDRRNADLDRTLREAQARGEVPPPRHSLDPLVKQLFDARIGVNEARDSTARKLWQARLDTIQWVFDSAVHTIAGPRIPVSYADRVTDSLTRELAKLRMFYTEEHPEVRALIAKLQSIAFVFPDSIAALEPSPGCTSGTGASVIKLIVPNEAGARAGSIVVQSDVATARGASVKFDDGMTCSGPGELRLYGRGAFDGRPIVVRSTLATSMVVVTGSGRVLAGPILLANEAHRHELTWSPR